MKNCKIKDNKIKTNKIKENNIKKIIALTTITKYRKLL